MAEKIPGVILAGGLSSRMGGGDKCLLSLGSETLLQQVIARLRPQVSAMVLNANGDPSRFADYCLPVVADGIEGYAGPLAGVLAGLDWRRRRVRITSFRSRRTRRFSRRIWFTGSTPDGAVRHWLLPPALIRNAGRCASRPLASGRWRCAMTCARRCRAVCARW